MEAGCLSLKSVSLAVGCEWFCQWRSAEREEQTNSECSLLLSPLSLRCLISFSSASLMSVEQAAFFSLCFFLFFGKSHMPKSTCPFPWPWLFFDYLLKSIIKQKFQMSAGSSFTNVRICCYSVFHIIIYWLCLCFGLLVRPKKQFEEPWTMETWHRNLSQLFFTWH